MIIGLAGPACSGKTTVANYLVKTHNFQILRIGSNPENGEKPWEEALKEISEKWRNDFVIYPFCSLEQVLAFRKKPYFILVGIDAPVLSRFNRYQSKGSAVRSLEDFISQDDQTLFNLSNPSQQASEIRQCMNLADVTVFNAKSESYLEEEMRLADLTNPERLRPSWDTYFIQLAELAARRSNCMKRRVGCVLVSENRVISTGYNGTPRNTKNCKDGGCQRCNSDARRGEDLEKCLCLHAEENALLEAGRQRANGAVLYCTTCPCLSCAKKIVQVGVSKVVYEQPYGMDEATQQLFNEAKVKYVIQQRPICLFFNLENRK